MRLRNNRVSTVSLRRVRPSAIVARQNGTRCTMKSCSGSPLKCREQASKRKICCCASSRSRQRSISTNGASDPLRECRFRLDHRVRRRPARPCSRPCSRLPPQQRLNSRSSQPRQRVYPATFRAAVVVGAAAAAGRALACKRRPPRGVHHHEPATPHRMSTKVTPIPMTPSTK